MRVSLFLVVVLGLLAGQAHGHSRETVRGRLNSAGTNQVEAMMRDMIRKVNDLIKQYTRVNNMQIGPVNVESFRVRTLDTANVNIIMNSNRLGVKLNNARVHLTANLAVYIPVFIGHIKVAGQFDTYGDNINSHLDTSVGIAGGKFRSNGMGCSLHVGSPRVDLHLPIINHLANMILQGLMPSVTNAVCEGVKKYGNGMINSVFQSLPSQFNVFNLFNLHFPVTSFRSWNRHMVAGIGLELRPTNNRPVDMTGMRLLAIPEAEDRHMACVSASDWVINSASRTFLPAGTSFAMNVGSILKLFFGNIFGNDIFVQGTISDAPLFLVEPDEMKFSIAASGRLLDKDGNVIPNTETDPVKISVETPTNTNPLFKSVKISVKGPITFHADLDLSIIIDYIIDLITKKAKVQEILVKRANTTSLKNALNKMLFGNLFSNLSVAFQARHGALITCLSAYPNSRASYKVLQALRGSFRG